MANKGLFGKFFVKRIDGRDEPGNDKQNARYFVLDYVNDPFAIKALEAYAGACREAEPELANDLLAICASGEVTGSDYVKGRVVTASANVATDVPSGTW